MGRIPCCEKDNVKRGQWTPEEDNKLSSYIAQHGTRNWRLIPKNAGLCFVLITLISNAIGLQCNCVIFCCFKSKRNWVGDDFARSPKMWEKLPIAMD